jgi:hypothetical protein
MAGRGEYTAEVAAYMESFLGRPSSRVELRLIPYLQYVMVNEQKLDPLKLNAEERDVIALLRDAGHVEGGMTGFRVTEEFWNFMCGVLLIAYVDYRDRPRQLEEAS